MRLERFEQLDKINGIKHFITNLMNRDSSDVYVERAIQRSRERLKCGVALLAELGAKITSLTLTAKNSIDNYGPEEWFCKIE